ncbi:MAG: M20/M25/M40 family metallo-hydrolase [Acidobacteria bacterium]|nr:M20/M25/M40 family metallo-hydrolase [Acidobacteriota bacterium]
MFRGVSKKVCLILFFGAIAAVSAQAQQSPVDFAKLNEEATQWLVELTRINTTNPPGNELAAAKYLASILEKEGITAEVLESSPGRGIVVARLRSSPVPDPSRALLLLAHTDVVGVDAKKWTTDPFGGAVKDGYIWGRGVIDDKGPVIANLAVMIALKRAGVKLDRDVIFLAEGDEEAGGEDGINFAINKHWEKIAAGFALNEGGRTQVVKGKVQYVGIQASEKVSVNVEVIATGPSGHASIPRKDNPIGRLAVAVQKIFEYETPAKPNTVTRRYFEKLAAFQDAEMAKWMRALEQPERMTHAARIISEADPVWNSMLRNSISPTILKGGIRTNVIPSEARANLNVRLLPGEAIEALLDDLRKLVNDPQIRFEPEPLTRQAAPPSSLETEMYKAFETAAERVFPGTPVVPLMSTWATDSAQLRVRNVQCYGIIPFPLTEEEIGRMHADDERLPVAALQKGIEYLYAVVEDFVKAR